MEFPAVIGWIYIVDDGFTGRYVTAPIIFETLTRLSSWKKRWGVLLPNRLEYAKSPGTHLPRCG